MAIISLFYRDSWNLHSIALLEVSSESADSYYPFLIIRLSVYFAYLNFEGNGSYTFSQLIEENSGFGSNMWQILCCLYVESV